MSDFHSLIAISFLGVPGGFLIFYVSGIINDLGDQIVTGFIGDHPIPAKQRRRMLYSTWVSYFGAVVGAALFLALAEAVIANHVGHPEIRMLAYLAVFLFVISSVNWVIQGTVHFLSYRSLLRQAEAD